MVIKTGMTESIIWKINGDFNKIVTGIYLVCTGAICKYTEARKPVS